MEFGSFAIFSLESHSDYSGFQARLAAMEHKWFGCHLAYRERSLDTRCWSFSIFGWACTNDSQLLNPSIQASVLSALIRPAGYLLHDTPHAHVHAAHTSVNQDLEMLSLESPSKIDRKGKGKARAFRPATPPRIPPPVKLSNPDTCILFEGYMKAGKTINLYDWFESFSMTVMQGVEGGEEAAKRQAYARFMRSLHELDMLGFLRWSGRATGKKGGECVAKVVWTIPDADG